MGKRHVLTDSYRCILDVAYASASPRQVMDVYIPEGLDEPLPVVIDVHGGGWESGEKADLGSGKMLVQAGFVYAKITYRRSAEAPWPACIEDVKATVRFMRRNAARFGADPERISLSGHSAGSHLGMIAALTADTGLWTSRDNADESERVQAVVSQAGIVDLWRRYRRNFHDAGFRAEEERKFGRLLGKPLSEGALKPLSVLEHVQTARWAVPHLFVNAENDRLAFAGDTLLLAEAMRARSWPVEYHCLPQADHVDPRFWQEENLFRAVDFLSRHMPAHAATPALAS